MVRFKNSSLIIEIPCNQHTKPLEELYDLQTGLIDCINILDQTNAESDQAAWALRSIRIILKNALVDREQLGQLQDQAAINPTLKKVFS